MTDKGKKYKADSPDKLISKEKRQKAYVKYKGILSLRPSEIDTNTVYYVPNGKSRHYNEDRHFGTYAIYPNKEETLYGCHVVTIGRVKKWVITYDYDKAYVIQDMTVLVWPTMNDKTLVWVPALLLMLWGAGDTKSWIYCACKGAREISSGK